MKRASAFSFWISLFHSDLLGVQTVRWLSCSKCLVSFRPDASAICGMLEDGTKVKIATVQPDDGNQWVVVNDLDDTSARAQLWLESKRLTSNK
jgi:hypothetical protein